ncbi:MAG: glycosyltransferase family 4 protein [Planctomycetes bacterium]|nr:glycosyltransferase family 4 protein [Planctomycetota bacterium]
MSGLRILMPTTFYPPYNFGGDGIGIQRFVRALARRGHEVTVVHEADAYLALAGKEPERGYDEPEGVEVVGLRSGLGKLSLLLTHQFGRPVLHRGRLRELAERGGYDLINFHNVSLIGGPGIFRYGRQTKLMMAHEHWLVCESHVLWRHGRERCDERQCLRCVLKHRRPPQLWRRGGMLARAAREIDAFIAMSEFSRRKHAEFGFPEPMEVLPYFLPDLEPGEERRDLGPSPHERPYFLFVGRLEKIKGLDDVIPIFRRRADLELVIAGDGEHRRALEELAAGAPNVRFLGRVASEALARWYAHARALIVPSVCYETFGIILIESMRQGTPVIARELGPFVEILKTSGGGLKFGDEDELEAAIDFLARNDGARETLARGGRQAFRDHWSESAVIPRYLDIVARAAERRGDRALLEKLERTGS